MVEKKKKDRNVDKKVKPSVTNDQLGENAGEGRFERANTKSSKSRQQQDDPEQNEDTPGRGQPMIGDGS